jgi:hypothetical protein
MLMALPPGEDATIVASANIVKADFVSATMYRPAKPGDMLARMKTPGCSG